MGGEQGELKATTQPAVILNPCGNIFTTLSLAQNRLSRLERQALRPFQPGLPVLTLELLKDL